jgi:hypothetical protein
MAETRRESMPLPLIAALAAAAFGAASKPKRKQAVSQYKKKNGTKVKAYTRKAPR